LELAVAYVITAGCIDVLDKTCIDECPVDCIYVGERMLYIHPDECVDCGACEPVCPQEAIYHEEDVPETMAGFTAANRDFFAELGNPGGAARVSQPGPDVPLVAGWPVPDRA
jgi:NAD-dependent dihydropyrimidine dehydrogenase PreA subunit